MKADENGEINPNLVEYSKNPPNVMPQIRVATCKLLK